MEKLKLGVFCSGTGSNLQSIIQACHQPSFPAEILFVFSNNLQAPALDKAQKQGIPTHAICHKTFKASREEYDDQINEILTQYDVNLLVLAGYLRRLSGNFLKKCPHPIINIHPSILPAFKGLHAQRQAFEAGVKYTGCTVHYVTEEIDCGAIIAQAVVPVKQDDTCAQLTERILKQEHQLLPSVISAMAQKKFFQDGSHVHFKQPHEQNCSLMSLEPINKDISHEK